MGFGGMKVRSEYQGINCNPLKTTTKWSIIQSTEFSNFFNTFTKMKNEKKTQVWGMWTPFPPGRKEGRRERMEGREGEMEGWRDGGMEERRKGGKEKKGKKKVKISTHYSFNFASQQIKPSNSYTWVKTAYCRRKRGCSIHFPSSSSSSLVLVFISFLLVVIVIVIVICYLWQAWGGWVW